MVMPASSHIRLIGTLFTSSLNISSFLSISRCREVGLLFTENVFRHALHRNLLAPVDVLPNDWYDFGVKTLMIWFLQDSSGQEGSCFDSRYPDSLTNSSLIARLLFMGSVSPQRLHKSSSFVELPLTL